MNQTIKPDAKYLIKQWWGLAIGSVFIAVFGLFFQILIPLKEKFTAADVAGVVWPIVFCLIILMVIISVPLIKIWHKNLSYHIDEERITINQGILTKVQKNIPYRAITDFLLHRSLFDQWLGIASVRIQTAGQSQSAAVYGYEGDLAALTEWDPLINVLRNKIRVLHGTSTDIPGVSGGAPGKPESEADVLLQILDELKSIRTTLEKK